MDAGLQCFAQITEYVEGWLHIHLRGRRDAELPTEDQLRELWTLLGVDLDILEKIIMLGFWWDGTWVNIRSASFDNPGTMKLLKYVLLTIWKHHLYCGSRWITVGTCNMHYVAGSASGQRAMIKDMLNDPSVKKCFLSGAKRATPEVVAGMTIAAVSSLPTSECLHAQLTDNRVVKRWREWQAVCRDECLYLDNLSDFTWQCLGRECEMELGEIRSHCLFAAHVSVMGLDWRIFSRMQQDPWRRAEGDIDKHLEEVCSSPEPPSETTLNKWWRLDKMAWPRVNLRRGVALLAEARGGCGVIRTPARINELASKIQPRDHTGRLDD